MKRFSILLSCLFLNVVVYGQQASALTLGVMSEQQAQMKDTASTLLEKLKVSGYIQTQFQYGEKDSSLKGVTANESDEKSFHRIGIRRGRIKFIYEEGIASGVFQFDLTEMGVGFKDAYIHLKDPWFGTSAFRAGVFDRPFGYEISYSSSQRESPERSTVFQTLFPEERDLGGMLILQAAKTSPLHFLKLEAGLFAGNGIKQETDNRKDFIGHVSANKHISDNVKFGVGVSYYNGGVYQGTENIYTMKDKAFVLNNNASNIGKFAKREYIGLDGQLNVISSLGVTQLRGEYLLGSQPGSNSSSKSPNASTLPTTDTYVRNFSGGYIMLVQDLGTLPLSAVIKYDLYDPNIKVSKNEIGLNGTAKADIAYNTIGLGLLWSVTNSVRLQAYYEFVNSEKSDNLMEYTDDLKEDVFTLRLQYKF